MTKQELMEKAKEMIAAPSCCSELKDAANAWLDAVGTEKEEEAARGLILELKDDVTPIDNLIALCKSEQGAKIFGSDRAKAMAAHAEEVKAGGGKYCDCPACAAGEVLLNNQEILLRA